MRLQTEEEFNRYCRQFAVTNGIRSYMEVQVTNDLKVEIYWISLVQRGVRICIPDYFLGMPSTVMDDIILGIFRGGDFSGLRAWTASPAFRTPALRERYCTRLLLTSPRGHRDLRASFVRVCKDLGVEIPEPTLGWSSRVPKRENYIACPLLDVIAFSDDLNDTRTSRRDLDAIMESALKTMGVI